MFGSGPPLLPTLLLISCEVDLDGGELQELTSFLRYLACGCADLESFPILIYEVILSLCVDSLNVSLAVYFSEQAFVS